jgi:hypothetical protein
MTPAWQDISSPGALTGMPDANQFAAALADIQRVNSFECLDNDPIAWNAPQFGVILQHIRSTYRRRAKRRHD